MPPLAQAPTRVVPRGSPQASEPTQLERAIHEEQIRRLKECLGILSNDELDVIYRRFFLGQAFADICKETNTPIGTLGPRVSRALEKLKHRLEREDFFDE